MRQPLPCLVSLLFACGRAGGEDGASLLQHAAEAEAEAEEAWPLSRYNNDGGLAFMHIPYNFGHTVENVAMLFGPMRDAMNLFKYPAVQASKFVGAERGAPPWIMTQLMTKPGGVAWGHRNPDLKGTNPETGCKTYYAPPKYWPEDLARSYFGNNTVFGILRDPYERLVSQFRGNIKGYGNTDFRSHLTCDVNRGIKRMLQRYLKKDKFSANCAFLPQAEYFEGKYGIKLAVDNRKFPHSMNEVFKQYGYGMHIKHRDVLHVNDCPNVWAADLDEETRQLIRKIYKKDFELLCEKFGYCDNNENTCLQYIENMCPLKAFNFNIGQYKYVPRRGSVARAAAAGNSSAER